MKNISFDSILPQLRKSHAMTQKELAKRLSVHLTTVKNWENAACTPDAKNICAISDVFHVSTDYLLGREHSDTISLESLTPAQRRQVLHIVQAYIDTIPENPSK